MADLLNETRRCQLDFTPIALGGVASQDWDCTHETQTLLQRKVVSNNHVEHCQKLEDQVLLCTVFDHIQEWDDAVVGDNRSSHIRIFCEEYNLWNVTTEVVNV